MIIKSLNYYLYYFIDNINSSNNYLAFSSLLRNIFNILLQLSSFFKFYLDSIKNLSISSLYKLVNF